MPKFSYVAMDSRGKETKGTLDVANQNEAIGRLKEMSLFPTKVVETDKTKDKKAETKGKVIAAMFYPVAVMVVATGILAVLMVWVVPKFKDIFKDMLPGQGLPAFTQLVLGISDMIANNFIFTAAGVIVFFIGLKIFTK